VSKKTPDTQRMEKVFLLAIEEIERVLSRQKAITDITKTAVVTLSNYSRLKSAEIHEKALDVLLTKQRGPKLIPQKTNDGENQL